jgi:voltage-gated potassium channel
MPRHGSRALRHRLYEILEHGSIGDRAGRLVSWLIVLLIVINLIAVALESVPEFEARYAASFLAIELFSLLVFTIEYGLRMWGAVETRLLCRQLPGRHALSMRPARLD